MNTYLTVEPRRRAVTTALMLASSYQMGHLIISAALSRIAADFPQYGDTAIQMIMTFPDLAILLATVLVGQLSSRISPRSLIIAGLSCVAAAGLGGFLWHGSLTLLYLWSIVVGVGRGLFATSVIVMIQTCYPEHSRSRVLGLQSICLNLSGVILTVLGGAAASRCWPDCYLLFLPVLVPLFLAIQSLPRGLTRRAEKSAFNRRRLSRHVVVYSLIAFLFLIVYNVYIMNSSMLFSELGAEDPVMLSGLSNGAFLLGGAASAFVFSPMSKKLGDYMLPVAMLIVCAGLGLCCLTKNAGLLILAGFIIGSGISVLTPQISLSISRSVPPQDVSLSTSIYLGSLYVGGFLSAPIVTPLAALLGGGVLPRFALGAGLALAFAAAAFFLARTLRAKV